jgi:hypothetical protein
MRLHPQSILLAAGISALIVNPSFGKQMCGPRLSFKEVRFSEVRDLRRTWTAVLKSMPRAVPAHPANSTSGLSAKRKTRWSLSSASLSPGRSGNSRPQRSRSRSTSGETRPFSTTRSPMSRCVLAGTERRLGKSCGHCRARRGMFNCSVLTSMAPHDHFCALGKRSPHEATCRRIASVSKSRAHHVLD